MFLRYVLHTTISVPVSTYLRTCLTASMKILCFTSYCLIYFEQATRVLTDLAVCIHIISFPVQSTLLIFTKVNVQIRCDSAGKYLQRWYLFLLSILEQFVNQSIKTLVVQSKIVYFCASFYCRKSSLFILFENLYNLMNTYIDMCSTACKITEYTLTLSLLKMKFLHQIYFLTQSTHIDIAFLIQAVLLSNKIQNVKWWVAYNLTYNFYDFFLFKRHTCLLHGPCHPYCHFI